MNTLLSTTLSAARADATAWGTAIESATRTVVAVAVAVYCLGEALGRWVHETSTVLGQMHACLLAGHRQAAEALAPVAAATERFVLEALSVQQLRTLARQQLGSATRIEGRRIAQAKKSALLAALA
jgi:hypothetical protein